MKNSLKFLALTLFSLFNFQMIHAQIQLTEQPMSAEGLSHFRANSKSGQLKAEVDYNLYPNPAHDFLVIDGPKKSCDDSGCYSISIRNKQGVEVIKLDEIDFANKSIELDLRDLSAGYYYINIFLRDRHVFESRFIVEK